MGSLVLQRHFSAEPGELLSIVAAARLGLALPPPARPVQAEALVLDLAQEEQEQAPDLGDGQREEGAAGTPFSPPALAVARVTARKAWASRHKVTWRCQPAQERTSD